MDFIVELRKKTMQKPAEVILHRSQNRQQVGPRWCKPIRSLDERKALKVAKSIGVYLGRERLTYDGFDVWPLELFLKALHEGNVF